MQDNLNVTLRIGKKGITEGLINEIQMQLKKKKTIKIKLLKSSVMEKNRQDIIDEILEKTGSRIIKNVGFVIILDKI